MIGKQVVLDLIVDEQTNIGLLNDKYIQLNGDAFGAFAEPCAVAKVYMAKSIRCPSEFQAARECIAQRINELQAILG